MPARGRWIKVDVGTFKHELFRREPFCRAAAWLWLLSEAAWQDNGTVRRGELVVSQRFMSEAWGWSRAKVRRFLDTLEAAEMIAVDRPTNRPTNRPTPEAHLTICNYDRYQATRPIAAAHQPAHQPAQTVETALEVVETTSTPSLRSVVDGEFVQAELIDPIEIVDPTAMRKKMATAMIFHWVELQAVKPPQPELKKQYRKAERLAMRYELNDIVMAYRGIALLFPYVDGAPWDMFDLEKKFGKAMQAAAVENVNIGELRVEQDILKALRG